MECDVIKKNYFSVVRPFLEEKRTVWWLYHLCAGSYGFVFNCWELLQIFVLVLDLYSSCDFKWSSEWKWGVVSYIVCTRFCVLQNIIKNINFFNIWKTEKWAFPTSKWGAMSSHLACFTHIGAYTLVFYTLAQSSKDVLVQGNKYNSTDVRGSKAVL